MELAHTKSVGEVLEFFNVNESTGLTSDEVKLSQEKYGPNGMNSSFFIFASLFLQQSFVVRDEIFLKE